MSKIMNSKINNLEEKKVCDPSKIVNAHEIFNDRKELKIEVNRITSLLNKLLEQITKINKLNIGVDKQTLVDKEFEVILKNLNVIGMIFKFKNKILFYDEVRENINSKVKLNGQMKHEINNAMTLVYKISRFEEECCSILFFISKENRIQLLKAEPEYKAVLNDIDKIKSNPLYNDFSLKEFLEMKSKCASEMKFIQMLNSWHYNYSNVYDSSFQKLLEISEKMYKFLGYEGKIDYALKHGVDFKFIRQLNRKAQDHYEQIIDNFKFVLSDITGQYNCSWKEMFYDFLKEQFNPAILKFYTDLCEKGYIFSG